MPNTYTPTEFTATLSAVADRLEHSVDLLIELREREEKQLDGLRRLAGDSGTDERATS